MMSHPSDHNLNDLLFELVAVRTPKFLIAVCSNSDRESELRAALNQSLSSRGKHITDIPAESLKDNMLGVFSDRSRSGINDGISISNISNMDASDVRQLFAGLNFHRDWLAKLNLPIILWISTGLLNQLVKFAPDFWSRRSAVYYFDGGSISELLDKLFSRAKAEEKEWSLEPTLSDAFEKILSCEKELGRCLRDKKSFSLAKVDDLIREIRMGVSQLIEECEKGRQIEVALWFWTFSHLDSALQEMLDSLEPERRNRFEALYTDRNEALLHLSERMVSLLSDYLDQLEDNIRDKRRINLVLRARTIATMEINRMALTLASTLEIPLSRLGYEEDTREPYYWIVGEEIEYSFLAKAAADLESWLAGHSEEYPNFFSKQEAQLLKVLYSNRLGTSAIASELGISQRRATDKVRFLERKLRLYLGLPERLPKAKIALPPRH
jgi:hypothetical protein